MFLLSSLMGLPMQARQNQLNLMIDTSTHNCEGPAYLVLLFSGYISLVTPKVIHFYDDKAYL